MKILDRYSFDPNADLIGKGGFAKVYRAYDLVRKRTVALKFYTGMESDKYDIISEINRMEDIVHPNLIRYYDATVLQSTNALGEKEHIQIGIMEYANAGDIGSFFRQKRSLKVVHGVIADILRGLQFLHMQDIAHRDLKPKNILLSTKDEGVIAKIADFGISKRIGAEEETMSSQLLGSVEYMAPEQFAPAVYGINGKYDTNADLWSLGIIIYEIFTGKLPFGSRTQGITYEQILNNILFQDLEVNYDNIPEPYATVIRRCLVKKAAQRVRQAEELLDILEGRKSETPPKIATPSDKTEPISTAILEVNTSQPTTKPTEVIQPIANDKTPPPPKNEEKQPTFDPPPLSSKTIAQEIGVGKKLFELGNYVESFKILDKYSRRPEFDTEAKFYLGFMYYNGKCGGAHDVERGKQLMNEARQENRALVLELMVKHISSK